MYINIVLYFLGECPVPLSRLTPYMEGKHSYERCVHFIFLCENIVLTVKMLIMLAVQVNVMQPLPLCQAYCET